MKTIELSHDLLNSNKILFHYGKMLEDISKGKEDFNPIAIEIQPTAKCNHSCIHCSYMERNESRASLSKEVMEKLIQSIINMKIKAVYFSGGGEPTLYPELGSYINRLYENGIESSIITNGTCFENMGLISIANKLNYIAISVPAVELDTFKVITGTSNMEKVLSLPKKIKEVHGEHSPIIGSRIILTNKNYKQVGKFIEVIKEREFDYALFKVVRDYEDNGQGLNGEEENTLKELISEYKDIDPNFTNINSIFDFKSNPEFKNKCWINHLGMLANVSPEGEVYPNVVEIGKEEFCIGNLYSETLEEMWNSSKHQNVKNISDKKWINGECKNCRAMSYNRIINNINDSLPNYYDPFI